MSDIVNETPTLALVIQQAIEQKLCDVHVSLPGRIVSYDSKTQKAKVQPEIKREYSDGRSLELPVLTDVPVIWPRAGGAYLHLPLKPGHQVTILFSERSLDEWKQKGGSIKASERRKHNISDAVCFPGGYPFNNAADVPNGSDVFLVNDKSEMKLTSAGKIEFKGNGGEKLLALVTEYMEINNMATTNTMFGPMKKNEHSQLIAITNKVKKLKA